MGRYLDFEKVDDPEHVYTLDFNLAYNPYCAYTSAYGCAIPRKEDRLDLAITAVSDNKPAPWRITITKAACRARLRHGYENGVTLVGSTCR